jgi:phytoene dehydrogenase-like protein
MLKSVVRRLAPILPAAPCRVARIALDLRSCDLEWIQPDFPLAQPSVFDSTRAPAGRHIAWAYCHVPPGCASDMTLAIESQIE